MIDALEEYALGRVTYEFLRRAILMPWSMPREKSNLSVDILHFDGHGALVEVSEKEVEKAPELDGKLF